MIQFIFATHNHNKLKEVKALLSAQYEVLSLNDVDFTNEIEETETTLEGNALLKAKTIYNITNVNCFADDSGLLVDSLGGKPGVYSARYAGEQKNDEDNIEKLLYELNGQKNRKAHFKTVLALILNGKEYLFEGIIKGTITTQKLGSNGFGYDPIFIPDGYTDTFAQMTSDTKNAISHRAIALKKMVEFIKTQF